jgi:dihydrofolate reductase
VPDGITLTDDDPVEVVRRLRKEEGTGIWLCGGGALAAALVDEIDRLVLKINPIVLLEGTPLFAGGSYLPQKFRLVASTPYQSGVTVNEYVRSGSTP